MRRCHSFKKDCELPECPRGGASTSAQNAATLAILNTAIEGARSGAAFAPALDGEVYATGDLVRAMRACPQPIVAAVEGTCAGAGAILAMASDLRLAQQGTRTAFLFTRVGLSGADMGACSILPRIIGQGRAAELLFTGRDMSSEEGLAWGFYNRVVEDVSAEAYALAEQLAAGPSIAHAITKRQLECEWNVSLDEALEMEARAQARCMETNDFKRAYEAFANKQKPVFQGN